MKFTNCQLDKLSPGDIVRVSAYAPPLVVVAWDSPLLHLCPIEGGDIHLTAHMHERRMIQRRVLTEEPRQ